MWNGRLVKIGLDDLFPVQLNDDLVVICGNDSIGQAAHSTEPPYGARCWESELPLYWPPLKSRWRFIWCSSVANGFKFRRHVCHEICNSIGVLIDLGTAIEPKAGPRRKEFVAADVDRPSDFEKFAHQAVLSVVLRNPSW